MAFICEVTLSKWTQIEVYEWAAENFGEETAKCFEGKIVFQLAKFMNYGNVRLSYIL